MEYIKRAREVFEIEIEGLKKVQEGLDGGFSSAITAILNALDEGGKVVITGMGKSMHVGQKIAATLTSTGTPTVVLHPSEAMHGDLGIVQDHDVVLALSFSGESDELLTVMPLIKRKQVTTIAVCQGSESRLARLCDLHVPVPVEREACPFNMAPTASTTATLALGDALAIVLLEARGFEKEDYAKLHPSGAIGRALLTRVADIMRGKDRLPMVQPSTLVKEAVEAMNSSRAGAVAIVDSEQHLSGVITDGDLRRHIASGEPLADKPVEEIMTRDPICIRESELAVTALKVFETHNIDDLVVIDDSGRVVGMVDIQDLPKLKIL